MRKNQKIVQVSVVLLLLACLGGYAAGYCVTSTHNGVRTVTACVDISIERGEIVTDIEVFPPFGEGVVQTLAHLTDENVIDFRYSSQSPGFVATVESISPFEWAIMAAFSSPAANPNPDCSMSTDAGWWKQRQFGRCMKKCLDGGGECTVHKDGDEYHAHWEAKDIPQVENPT